MEHAVHRRLGPTRTCAGRSHNGVSFETQHGRKQVYRVKSRPVRREQCRTSAQVDSPGVLRTASAGQDVLLPALSARFAISVTQGTAIGLGWWLGLKAVAAIDMLFKVALRDRFVAAWALAVVCAVFTFVQQVVVEYRDLDDLLALSTVGEHRALAPVVDVEHLFCERWIVPTAELARERVHEVFLSVFNVHALCLAIVCHVNIDVEVCGGWRTWRALPRASCCGIPAAATGRARRRRRPATSTAGWILSLRLASRGGSSVAVNLLEPELVLLELLGSQVLDEWHDRFADMSVREKDEFFGGLSHLGVGVRKAVVGHHKLHDGFERKTMLVLKPQLLDEVMHDLETALQLAPKQGLALARGPQHKRAHQVRANVRQLCEMHETLHGGGADSRGGVAKLLDDRRKRLLDDLRIVALEFRGSRRRQFKDLEPVQVDIGVLVCRGKLAHSSIRREGARVVLVVLVHPVLKCAESRGAQLDVR
mmetsp:Transcript_2371/g.7328  ORF Transcript_2371/g.7328 Transcript_2371/m.7328 type:complete len:479 (+) Transcript_2371:189-1625(+)